MVKENDIYKIKKYTYLKDIKNDKNKEKILQGK